MYAKANFKLTNDYLNLYTNMIPGTLRSRKATSQSPPSTQAVVSVVEHNGVQAGVDAVVLVDGSSVEHGVVQAADSLVEHALFQAVDQAGNSSVEYTGLLAVGSVARSSVEHSGRLL